MVSSVQTETKLICFHCGEECKDNSIREDEKVFCCQGCQLVYDLLNKNGLCVYYDLNENPGLNQKEKLRSDKFAFLDDNQVKQKLYSFTDGKQSRLTFYLPQMHCSSCIWLLENMHKLNPAIITSRVDFPRKTLDILYAEDLISLRQLAELLTRIGYEPHISLKDLDEKQIKKVDRGRLLRLGVAGFCFGNIMMLSLPEYLSGGAITDLNLRHLFSWLILALSLPVFLYSATEFYNSAWQGLKQRFLNIDTPIVLAIGITFFRSAFEIITGTGAGYLDSMAGIVFFMLAGRIFQDYTYQSLYFDRDFKSYFPISVCRKKNGQETYVPVSDIKPGDRILIRSHELIPVDGILFYGKALIDYSFVTGESVPVEKTIGEILYAGGKQTGGELELEVIKDVSQSYLTQLWNNGIFKEKTEKRASFIHALSRHFTWGLLGLALFTSCFWIIRDPSRAFNAVTAILIVACPCALLLSATFTNGHIMRVLGKNGLYLKNASTIEALASADRIIFDKTGTITHGGSSKITYEGSVLSPSDKQLIRSLARQSNHALSRSIVADLPDSLPLQIASYKEYPGRGAQGLIGNRNVLLGSSDFLGIAAKKDADFSKVYVQIDKNISGCFMIKNSYRNGMEDLIRVLRHKYTVSLLSGDNDSEKNHLIEVFGSADHLSFDQSPEDKLRYIKKLQDNGHRAIMIGDGLNDSGALMQSDAGIALSDNINNFSPACDAILSSDRFNDLPRFLAFAKAGKKIILLSFAISLLYNGIGLALAVQGTLSPVVAAILMPLSSLSILTFTAITSKLSAKNIGLKLR